MRIGVHDLVRAWRLPGRALLFGMPLTLGPTAVLARWTIGLPWVECFLVGAVLSPTDPVLASALVGNEAVPGRLRHLLTVESGVNDGLALPFVLVFMAAASRAPAPVSPILGELALGLAIGTVVPALVVALDRLTPLAAAPEADALGAIAVGLLVFATARALHGNVFLAAFAGGVAMASLSERLVRAYDQVGSWPTPRPTCPP
jgi:NhaP-type Na+/H+ or K+/H+ antiporter